MAASDFTIKRGDTWPPLVFTLSDDLGGVDLSTASSITVHLKLQSGVALVEGEATADADQNANPGKASYSWDTGDTDEAGVYNGEVEVIWQTGKVQTFPNGHDPAAAYFTVEIEQDLA